MTQFNEMEKISEANIDDGHLFEDTILWNCPQFQSVINVSVPAVLSFKVSAIFALYEIYLFWFNSTWKAERHGDVYSPLSKKISNSDNTRITPPNTKMVSSSLGQSVNKLIFSESIICQFPGF